MKNILVIAPHPDDEVLGCGATINKLSENGGLVVVLVMTRGTPRFYSDEKIENVRNEARQAHKILGVRDTIFLDYPAPELDTVSQADLSSAISDVIKQFNVDTVFIPHRGDIHLDHTIVFRSGLVACRPVNNCSVKEILSYETLSETEWAPPFSDDAFIPDCFFDVTAQMKFKLDAMNCFRSQVRKFPNPRSLETMEALAKFRGATAGYQRAEAFMTIRRLLS